MRTDLRLYPNMVNRGIIILLALSCLALPFLAASARAGGCCGAMSDHKGDATADTERTHKRCCCEDAPACDCQLNKEDSSPSAEVAPAPAEPDRRVCLTGLCTASAERIVPYQDQPFPPTPFTYARAPAADIFVLNSTFIR